MFSSQHFFANTSWFSDFFVTLQCKNNAYSWGAWAFALAEIIPVEPDTDNADAGTRFSFHLLDIYAYGKKKTSYR